jgi:hypothetical protein
VLSLGTGPATERKKAGKEIHSFLVPARSWPTRLINQIFSSRFNVGDVPVGLITKARELNLSHGFAVLPKLCMIPQEIEKIVFPAYILLGQIKPATKPCRDDLGRERE